MSLTATTTFSGEMQAELIERLERMPISRIHVLARLFVGCATFFDGYTALAIAYALPVLVREWHLAPQQAGLIISSGYLGQMVGALFFGWLAERIGRLRALTICVAIYALMNILCIFAWDMPSLAVFRFIQGIGLGGEVPVAATYISEFAKARGRGRFVLLYELLFNFGLLLAGICGIFLVPVFGWQAMFAIGAIPAILIVPLQFILPESPRWLISKGRISQAKAIIERIEFGLQRRGIVLPPPEPIAVQGRLVETGRWRELFSPFYRRRTLMLWSLWLCAYMINNGVVTWLPTLYTSVFHLPLRTALLFGFATTGIAIFAALFCALFIDSVGRRRWFTTAFSGGALMLLALGLLGATSAVEVLVLATCAYGMIQTVSLSLYLYTNELYPTRIRAVGCGTGSAWLRLGSSIGPAIVGFIVASTSISWVFLIFAGIAAIGALVCQFFVVESRGQVLEVLSP